jgi:hypothetical protein
LGNGKKGLRVSPWGVPSLDDLRKRFSRFYRFNGFNGFNGGGAAHFVILSSEKRRMLRKR